MDNGKHSTSIMLVWSNINEKSTRRGESYSGRLGYRTLAVGRIGLVMLFTASALVPEDVGFNIVKKDNINGGYV